MTLSSLIDKRLILVSGKGGVGKTAVSVLIAMLAAQKKKSTLIVEFNATGRIAPIFDVADAGHEEIALAPYISGLNLSPKSCFEEYVIKRIHFKSIYQAFFDNKFVSNFINAVPGLNEILMLGKIYDLEKKKKNIMTDAPLYDLIIVDLPATGHGLSALEVPRVLVDAVKIGPLHKHATSILELLQNKSKTAFCLTTLAEEMPVCESKEYVAALTKRTKIPFGPLFVNQVMPAPEPLKLKPNDDDETEALFKYYELTKSRAKLNAFYLDVIEKEFADFKTIILPFCFEGLDRAKDFKKLAKSLSESTE